MESSRHSPLFAMAGLSVAALVAATGCSGNVDVPRANAGPLAQAGTVSIRGFAHGADGVPLAGVNVCLGTVWWANAPSEVCVTSAKDGSFLLPGAGANESTSVWFSNIGFLPVVRAIQTRAADVVLPEDENVLFSAVAPAKLMGANLDPTLGHVMFYVATDGQGAPPNVPVLATGTGPSPAPVYLDSKGDPVAGASMGTRGGFVNIEPGL